MIIFKTILGKLFPKDLWDARTKRFFWCLAAKFIIFDLVWCSQTTFSSLSMIDLYINTFFVVLLLLLPYLASRSRIVESVVLIALDLLLISNPMYSRTYNALIPLNSYAAAGNLSDFTASVVDSMRWIDVLFPRQASWLSSAWQRRNMLKGARKPGAGNSTAPPRPWRLPRQWRLSCRGAAEEIF